MNVYHALASLFVRAGDDAAPPLREGSSPSALLPKLVIYCGTL